MHNAYRTPGGEERTVAELMWLVREHLGLDAELLERSSRELPRRRAALGLLRGGLEPREVGDVVRRAGARVVHAHNLNPALGWRALAAARAAGARVVLHLHNYRLVCAVGTCFTEGADCTRCHGRATHPGVVHNCRGALGEAVPYAISLAAWQRRMAGLADAVIVPSAAARRRLADLGAPLDPDRVHVVAPVVRAFATAADPPADGPALVAGRLAPEKGVEVAIEACHRAHVPRVVAGDGPLAAQLRARARGDVELVGRVPAAELAALRARASVAVIPSRSAETFALAAAEAMAAGLPVAASRIGALPELVEEAGLAAPGDPADLARVIAARRGDAEAGRRGLHAVRERCAPEVVADSLRAVYAAATEGAPADG